MNGLQAVVPDMDSEIRELFIAAVCREPAGRAVHARTAALTDHVNVDDAVKSLRRSRRCPDTMPELAKAPFGVAAAGARTAP
jgi:hypothetical protein